MEDRNHSALAFVIERVVRDAGLSGVIWLHGASNGAFARQISADFGAASVETVYYPIAFDHFSIGM